MRDKQAVITELIGSGVRVDVAADLVTNLYLDVALDGCECFADFLKWRGSLDVSRGQSSDTLAGELGALVDALAPDAAAGNDKLRRLLEGARPLVGESECETVSFIGQQTAAGELARDYLAVLIAGKRRQATELILTAVNSGTPIKEIYVNVFQPVLWEVGRLWQRNQLGVGQEHFCTAATQAVMAQLYPQLFAGQRNGRSLVATTIVGNLHEVGIRMVADLCELEGWDTYYLGASTPIESLLQVVADQQPEVLCVSAAMSQQLDEVRQLILAVRQQPAAPAVKIVVGGHGFLGRPDVWREVGADGYGQDAVEAVRLIGQLTGV